MKVSSLERGLVILTLDVREREGGMGVASQEAKGE